jgi:hypothetical protein
MEHHRAPVVPQDTELQSPQRGQEMNILRRNPWVLTAYGLSGLAIFGMLYFVLDLMGQ